jgi:hypothetical protein
MALSFEDIRYDYSGSGHKNTSKLSSYSSVHIQNAMRETTRGAFIINHRSNLTQKVLRSRSWEVDGTASGACKMFGFGICGVGHPGYILQECKLVG